MHVLVDPLSRPTAIYRLAWHDAPIDVLSISHTSWSQMGKRCLIGLANYGFFCHKHESLRVDGRMWLWYREIFLTFNDGFSISYLAYCCETGKHWPCLIRIYLAIEKIKILPRNSLGLFYATMMNFCCILAERRFVALQQRAVRAVVAKRWKAFVPFTKSNMTGAIRCFYVRSVVAIVTAPIFVQ